MNQDLKDGVAYSIKSKGLAYTYANEGIEDNRDILNPDWVQLHSAPMCIIDIDDAIVSIKKQPLVFRNLLIAEGALMTLQLIHPKESINCIICEYTKEKKIVELKVGE